MGQNLPRTRSGAKRREVAPQRHELRFEIVQAFAGEVVFAPRIELPDIVEAGRLEGRHGIEASGGECKAQHARTGNAHRVRKGGEREVVVFARGAFERLARFERLVSGDDAVIFLT